MDFIVTMLLGGRKNEEIRFLLVVKSCDWWEWKPNGMRVIKPDAPKDAQESYKHYLEQTFGEQGKSL